MSVCAGNSKTEWHKNFPNSCVGYWHLDEIQLIIISNNNIEIMDYEEDQLIGQTRLCQLEELASDRWYQLATFFLINHVRSMP